MTVKYQIIWAAISLFIVFFNDYFIKDEENQFKP